MSSSFSTARVASSTAPTSSSTWRREGCERPLLHALLRVLAVTQEDDDPAPLGVLFHSEEALLRWMELHYVVLSEGLAFVDGRCQVRVHIIQDLKTAAATGADLNAIATESPVKTKVVA